MTDTQQHDELDVLFSRLKKIQDCGDFNGREITFAIEDEVEWEVVEIRLEQIDLDFKLKGGESTIVIHYWVNCVLTKEHFVGENRFENAFLWLKSLTYFIKEKADCTVGEGLI